MLQVRRHVEKVLRLNGGDVDDYDADGINIMSSKNKKYYEDAYEDEDEKEQKIKIKIKIKKKMTMKMKMTRHEDEEYVLSHTFFS